MYRKVKCKIAPFADSPQIVSQTVTVEREGQIRTLVEYVPMSMKDQAKNNLNPNLINASYVTETGNVISGSIDMESSAPDVIEETAQQVAQSINVE